jgi:uncharacterized cupin superfamily protein
MKLFVLIIVMVNMLFVNSFQKNWLKYGNHILKSSQLYMSSEMKVVKNPDVKLLAELGVKSWPTWGCDASKFPWSYDSTETCYILKGFQLTDTHFSI